MKEMAKIMIQKVNLDSLLAHVYPSSRLSKEICFLGQSWTAKKTLLTMDFGEGVKIAKLSEFLPALVDIELEESAPKVFLVRITHFV